MSAANAVSDEAVGVEAIIAGPTPAPRRIVRALEMFDELECVPLINNATIVLGKDVLHSAEGFTQPDDAVLAKKLPSAPSCH